MPTPLTLREQLEEANETIRQLRAAIEANVVSYEGIPATRTELVILAELLRSGVCSQQHLLDCIAATRPNADAVQPKNIDVHIHRIRRKLAEAVPSVQIRSAWGRGYYLDAEDKAALRAVVKA